MSKGSEKRRQNSKSSSAGGGGGGGGEGEKRRGIKPGPTVRKRKRKGKDLRLTQCRVAKGGKSATSPIASSEGKGPRGKEVLSPLLRSRQKREEEGKERCTRKAFGEKRRKTIVLQEKKKELFTP